MGTKNLLKAAEKKFIHADIEHLRGFSWDDPGIVML
jgi:hypothetical protein